MIQRLSKSVFCFFLIYVLFVLVEIKERKEKKEKKERKTTKFLNIQKKMFLDDEEKNLIDFVLHTVSLLLMMCPFYL